MLGLKIPTLSFFIAFGITGWCQPDVSWAFSLGGTNTDWASEIMASSSGSILVLGRSSSDDFDFENSLGESDAIITKMDDLGNIQWLKHFGGSGEDSVRDIQETPDGGFIVVGESSSSDGDLSSNQGNYDFWVFKLDANGLVEWSVSYGGSSDDKARAVCVTADQGFIVVGDSRSDDGDVSGNYGADDVWVIKLDATGNLIWEMHYGGSGGEYAAGIIQITGGEYIVLSGTESDDFDVSENYSLQANDDENDDGEDCWVLKLDAIGQIIWEQNFGGSGEESPEELVKIDDQKYLICGRTSSQDIDITDPNGSNDGWVMQINDQAELVWSNALGGSESDWINGITLDPAGGYIFAGSSKSGDGEVAQNYGGHDAWLGKLSVEGELLWEKNFGGTNDERARSIDLLENGQILFAGHSLSSDIDVETNSGGGDMWVVCLDSMTSQNLSPLSVSIDVAVSPNPAQDYLRISTDDLQAPIPIQIFNSNGQCVKEFLLQDYSKTFDISEFKSGTYVIKSTAGKQTTSQIIVVR
jgi:hypothetical protein